MQELSFIYTLAELSNAAAEIIRSAAAKRIWLFTGDMGTGKTTLIKAISTALGATGDLSSPTYSLANEYTIAGSGKKVFHLDLYRLRSIEEAIDIGIEDYLFKGEYCFIECPQLIMPMLRTGEFITIHSTSISKIDRKVSIFI